MQRLRIKYRSGISSFSLFFPWLARNSLLESWHSLPRDGFWNYYNMRAAKRMIQLSLSSMEDNRLADLFYFYFGAPDGWNFHEERVSSGMRPEKKKTTADTFLCFPFSSAVVWSLLFSSCRWALFNLLPGLTSSLFLNLWTGRQLKRGKGLSSEDFFLYSDRWKGRAIRIERKNISSEDQDSSGALSLARKEREGWKRRTEPTVAPEKNRRVTRETGSSRPEDNQREHPAGITVSRRNSSPVPAVR